ncbi:methyl-accepting chemotaxis protein [Blastopirellula sp. JC732]|uniref:Methyl-accepting chemotaxis protein n=1 Tax=Blastopirellula sediminis TaxID=2894196 RepID=A0A9X1SJS5_9BACT|nr:methyl-accepting chemotaxis protein [Blastopirellula sediminis]MCC9607638.1 methyl-accepting chemotaxis protein [Blastopirellula sediminis]MCC9629069.1 methyl-accepting chemotaxis protein [Blastopirellula sediminis]
MLNRLSLTKRTILGFASVLLLMLIAAGVAWNGLSNATTGFVRYRQLARDSNFCSNLQDCMMMARFAAKNFDIYSRDGDIEKFNARSREITGLLEEAKSRIDLPERRAIVDEIETLVGEYDESFTQVVANRRLRDAQQRDVLDVQGPQMSTCLVEIMNSSQADGDAEAAAAAGAVLDTLMGVRLSVYKYLDSAQIEHQEKTNQYLTKMDGELAKLDADLQNPHRRELLAKTRQSQESYATAYASMAEALQTERQLMTGRLDVIGPSVAMKAAALKNAITDEQDELGPQLQASNQATLVMVGVVSGVALVIGVVISILLSRSIILPIRKVMGVLNLVAQGDLRQQLKVETEDEIGAMTNSLNTVVKRLQAAMTDLAANAQEIARSATEMNDTAASMASVSNDTKTQSTSAAGASEEMSANMRAIAASATQMSANMDTVASAVEEMSISVNEIARNTEQANLVASEANQLAEGSRRQLGQLGDAANEIGKVVELIQGIAEQTNLLALNATIEAARAGEAGKGFAVVAEEVKQLARQTAGATEDIRARVKGMQQASFGSVESIESIRSVVNNLSEISRGIAAAIEEQSVATKEIANNVAQSSSAARQVSKAVEESALAGEEISRNVVSVDRGAQKVSEDAGKTKNSSDQLAGISSKLQSLVSQFQV